MKRLLVNIFLSLLTFTICGAIFSRPRSQAEMRQADEGELPGEPSCDELRAMWRFSRRQSRVAEVTNEFPTYRDPFAYNIWEPLPRLRSVLNRTPVTKTWSPPVYGRIVRHPPMLPPAPSALDELYREFQGDYQDDDDEDWKQPAAKVFQFPVEGPRYSQLSYESPHNRFDRVKQLLLSERAKESFKKMKAQRGQLAKNGQALIKDGVNGQGGNYNRYSAEEDGKADKLRLGKGGLDLDTPPASERFRKPLRRSSPYTWMDPSLIERYWRIG